MFLYLDPPYLSLEKKYRNNFMIRDLKDQKGEMDNHLGSHLHNLSTYDEDMEEIFREPDKVTDCANPLAEMERRKGFKLLPPNTV